MLEVYGFARVNKIAHGNTRDLRVLWALEDELTKRGIEIPNPQYDVNIRSMPNQAP